MSTDRCPTSYAEQIITALQDADANTARAALRIAETLLEHKVNAGVGFLLDEPQQVE
jgi:hypothetical protein